VIENMSMNWPVLIDLFIYLFICLFVYQMASLFWTTSCPPLTSDNIHARDAPFVKSRGVWT